MRAAATVLSGLLFLAACPGPCRAADACPPDGWPPARLQGLAAREFALAPDAGAIPDTLAIALLPCLSSIDPGLRDGIAFEALSRWMRAGLLSQATREALLARLSADLAPGVADPDGVRRPFAALVLSEVARTDRKAAWMTPAQRDTLVTVASDYLRGITDRRGFETGVGWRHGVAHASDLVLQLVLNPQVDKAQLDRMLAALATQVAPSGQSYVFGEPDRFARPVLYAAARNLHGDAEWKAWLAGVAAPAPFADWRSAVGSEAGLARRHDVHAFLLAVYAGARDSEDPAMLRLAPMAKALLDE